MYKSYTTSKSIITLAATIALFVVTTPLSYLALRGLSIDIVYIATSLNTIIVLGMSSIFLKESVSREQYTGAMITTFGVALYAL